MVVVVSSVISSVVAVIFVVVVVFVTSVTRDFTDVTFLPKSLDIPLGMTAFDIPDMLADIVRL